MLSVLFGTHPDIIEKYLQYEFERHNPPDEYILGRQLPKDCQKDFVTECAEDHWNGM